MRFSAHVAKFGSRWYLPVPFDPDATWGARDRHSVTGSINGCKIRGKIERFGNDLGVSLGQIWRQESGIDFQEEVEAELKPEGPQASSLAPDIRQALDSNPDAKAFFEALPTFYRKNYMRWLDSAKRPETRARRIVEFVDQLQNKVWRR